MILWIKIHILLTIQQHSSTEIYKHKYSTLLKAAYNIILHLFNPVLLLSYPFLGKPLHSSFLPMTHWSHFQNLKTIYYALETGSAGGGGG